LATRQALEAAADQVYGGQWQARRVAPCGRRL